MENNAFLDFKSSFVQPVPRYAVKPYGQHGWRTRKYALHDEEISKHLNGESIIACLSRWYPEYAAFDFDAVPLGLVEEARESLNLDESNSMLFSSESKDSYHLYFRPQYNGKPPTINLLQSVLKPYADSRKIEIYPMRNRAFRLPFGKGQECLDNPETILKSWQEKLYWLAKKDDFDLKGVPLHQTIFDLPATKITGNTVIMDRDAAEIYRYGLQSFSTRDACQFELVKYFWRMNLTRDDTHQIIWKWILEKHNGFSRDIIQHPKEVSRHISHQITDYYSHMFAGDILPDQPHKAFKGYITKPDLLEIVKVSEGSLPRMRFTFQLVKYMNPRRYRDRVEEVPSEILMGWVGRDGSKWHHGGDYIKHLQHLEGKGIIQRSSGYITPKMVDDAAKKGIELKTRAKTLKLKWPYKSDSEAVLFNGRAVENLEGAVELLFKPEEMRSILRGYGSKQKADWNTKALFGRSSKAPTL